MKLFFILSFLLLTNTAISVASTLTEEERIATDILWTSCGIEKYCAKTDYTDSDRFFIEAKATAQEILPKQVTCDYFLRKVSIADTLTILRATLIVNNKNHEQTCLSKVKALQAIE